MEGDGHGAYGGNSACIDDAIDAYLEEGALPELDTACEQRPQFGSAIVAGAEVAATERVAAVYRGRPLAEGR
jgi:hypothetical protein